MDNGWYKIMKLNKKNIKMEVKGGGKIKLDVNGQKVSKSIDRNKQRKDRIAKEKKEKDKNQRIKVIQDRIDTMYGQFNRNKDKHNSLKNIEQRKELDKRIIQLQKEKEQVRSTALKEIADM